MKYNMMKTVFASAVLAMSLAACSSSEKPAETASPAAPETTAETTPETVSTQAAIVGSWQLSKVLVSEKEGENPVEVQEEDHASMFGEKENVYTFNEDGTGTMLAVAGPDEVEIPVTWMTNEDGSYTVVAADTAEPENSGAVISADGETYLYDPVDDVLMRETLLDDPYMHVLTVYGRK